MSDRDTNRAWIVGDTVEASRCYHTRRDCPELSKAGDVKERSAAYCNGITPHCKVCSGESLENCPNYRTKARLLAMDPEEVLP